VKEAAKKLSKKTALHSSGYQDGQSTDSESGTQDGYSKPQLPTGKHNKVMRYIPSDALDIWAVAKTHLDRILKNDTHREAALNEAIEYCQKRIDSKK